MPTPEQEELFRLVQRGVCKEVCSFFEEHLGIDLNFLHTGGVGPLHVAVSCANHPMVEKLIMQGANATFHTREGQPPLEYALYHVIEEGLDVSQYEQAFCMLVDSGALCANALCDIYIAFEAEGWARTLSGIEEMFSEHKWI